MALSESALDVELVLDLGIGSRLGTNPRSESYIQATLITFGDELAFHRRGLCVSANVTLALKKILSRRIANILRCSLSDTGHGMAVVSFNGFSLAVYCIFVMSE